MKLFAFYIGGRMKNCLVEVHDVRVCIGDSIEACYPQLRDGWWGVRSSLHLDCWGELNQVDGYDIVLSGTPNDSGLRLWFVNLGGYEAGAFNELHKNVFVVAVSEQAAKAKALKMADALWTQKHRDGLFEVETLVNVADLFTGPYHIRLTKADVIRPFSFECGYRPLNRPAMSPPVS